VGNGVLAFLVAISAGTWIYTKLMRSTGSNTKNSLVGAAVAALLIFLAVFIIAGKLSG
jgi:hypothetical protein